MGEGQRSELTTTVLAVADALTADIESVANELEAIPFMEEEISQGEYRRRFHAMTPDQRIAEMRRIGTTELLRLMGGRNG